MEREAKKDKLLACEVMFRTCEPKILSVTFCDQWTVMAYMIIPDSCWQSDHLGNHLGLGFCWKACVTIDSVETLPDRRIISLTWACAASLTGWWLSWPTHLKNHGRIDDESSVGMKWTSLNWMESQKFPMFQSPPTRYNPTNYMVIKHY